MIGYLKNDQQNNKKKLEISQNTSNFTSPEKYFLCLKLNLKINLVFLYYWPWEFITNNYNSNLVIYPVFLKKFMKSE